MFEKPKHISTAVKEFKQGANVGKNGPGFELDGVCHCDVPDTSTTECVRCRRLVLIDNKPNPIWIP